MLHIRLQTPDPNHELQLTSYCTEKKKKRRRKKDVEEVVQENDMKKRRTGASEREK